MLRTEQARGAQSFVDSIGVNIHLSYHDGPYGNFPAIESLLKNLGVRHVRDGVSSGQTDVCREDRALNAAGMRFTYITPAKPTPQILTDWANCVGPSIEAYEGLNEYDISHPASDADWAATDQIVQKTLYNSVKGTPALAHLTVVAPSLTSPQAYRSVGDLSSYVDAGNMHDYSAGHDPGTPGWGANGYGSIPYNISAARIVDGNKPIEATETGFATEVTHTGLDDATQAKYVPRLFLEHFNAGVARTYEYELVDEGGPPFGHFGLVTGALTPKPAYTALASLISLLRDDGRGADAASGTLRYALGGDTAAVHHTLLAKRDGQLYLLLWVERMGFNSDTRARLSVRSQDVTLQLAGPVSSATLYRYDDDEHLRSTRLPTGPVLHLTVTDQVSVVELTPAGRPA
ncbi:MAG TPA: hypothetical protein VMA36_12770 [Candidatus Limnocylindria bacterium]|nr:hypothetical protein [Candidatus Limnocylindria bacterium]